MNQPRISVIIVVYNGVSCIEGAVQSVLDSGLSNVELVVQDGGSTDGTVDILQKYDDRIAHWISEPDIGVYDAMNKAVRNAGGDYVYFLGADDRLRKGLDTVAQHFKDPLGIYYGDVYRMQSGDRYAGPFHGNRLARTNISHQAMFFPRKLFDEMQFETKYPIQSDWAFNMACFARSDVEFHYIDAVIADFDDSEGLSSTRADEAFNADYLALVKRYFPRRVYLERRFILGVGAVLRKAGLIR